MRSLLLLLGLAACSSDTFVAPADAAPTDASADVAAVPISIVGATPIQIVTGIDPALTLTPPPAAGNAVIVGITCFSEVDNCVIPQGGVTDNQGNAYRRVVEGASIISSTTHGSRGYIFVAESVGPTNGAFTIRVDANGAPDANYQDFAWGALEVAGLAQANSVDKTGSVPNVCCELSTTVSTSGPTTQANELAVAVHTARSNDNNVNYGHEPTWTEHHVNVNGTTGASPHSMVTKVLSTTGIVSHTWTHDAVTRGTSAIIATFKGRTP